MNYSDYFRKKRGFESGSKLEKQFELWAQKYHHPIDTIRRSADDQIVEDFEDFLKQELQRRKQAAVNAKSTEVQTKNETSKQVKPTSGTETHVTVSTDKIRQNMRASVQKKEQDKHQEAINRAKEKAAEIKQRQVALHAQSESADEHSTNQPSKNQVNHQTLDEFVERLTTEMPKAHVFAGQYKFKRMNKESSNHALKLSDDYLLAIKEAVLDAVNQKFKLESFIDKVPATALVELSSITMKRLNQKSWQTWWLAQLFEASYQTRLLNFRKETFNPVRYVQIGWIDDDTKMVKLDFRLRFYWALILTPVTNFYQPPEQAGQAKNSVLDELYVIEDLIAAVLTQFVGGVVLNSKSKMPSRFNTTDELPRKVMNEVLTGQTIKSVQALIENQRKAIIHPYKTKKRTRYYHR